MELLIKSKITILLFSNGPDEYSIREPINALNIYHISLSIHKQDFIGPCAKVRG